MSYLERSEFDVTDPDALDRILPDAAKIVRAADGCLGVRALRGVEQPDRYLLLIDWVSVQHHINFSQTEEFREFVASVRQYFAGPSNMAHFAELTHLT
ncbi:MAG TPA: antibiotic biosynthesis monooxygenase family protein [Pseudonocardia sp.]|jgi:quinol monooxygenase YgiN